MRTSEWGFEPKGLLAHDLAIAGAGYTFARRACGLLIPDGMAVLAVAREDGIGETWKVTYSFSRDARLPVAGVHVSSHRAGEGFVRQQKELMCVIAQFSALAHWKKRSDPDDWINYMDKYAAEDIHSRLETLAGPSRPHDLAPVKDEILKWLAAGAKQTVEEFSNEIAQLASHLAAEGVLEGFEIEPFLSELDERMGDATTAPWLTGRFLPRGKAYRALSAKELVHWRARIQLAKRGPK